MTLNAIFDNIRQSKMTKNILNSMSWLFFDSVFRLSGGLLIGVWLARYLGAENFGQLNYAMAVVAIVGAFASLGLQNIAVKELVVNPNRGPVILLASFGLLFISGTVATLTAYASSFLIFPDEPLIKTLVIIISTSLLFRFHDVFKFFFEAKVLSRYVAMVSILIFVLTSIIKILLILNNFPLIFFAWAILIESAMLTIGLATVYVKKRNIVKVQPSELGSIITRDEVRKMSISLLRSSLPVMFMTILLGIYTKIDLFMVEYFLGWEATGLYSSAIKIAEAWFFVAIIITQSIYPSLISAEKYLKSLFSERVKYFYCLMFWLPMSVSAALYIWAEELFVLLFGYEFIGAAPIFSLYVWSSVFVFSITASSRWFLIKNKNTSLLYRAILGAVMNIILNYWLIQELGLNGAAVSTLISYFCVAYLYDVFDKNVRPQFILKITAIFMPFIWIAKRNK